jgi:anti-sigma-K factor RskA
METGIHELTPGYALDALEPEERAAYEAHLAGCASCQEELSAFLETTQALALAASGPEPSPSLRGRILDAARAEPPVVVPIEATRRRRLTPMLGVAAAVAAVVAIALGVWAAHLSSELDKTRSALDGQRSAAAVVADPNARKVSLSSGDGRLVVDDSGRAALVLDGLEAAPAGKTYEAWIIAGGTATPAGTFPGGNRVDVVGVDGVVEPGDVVAVTVERDGGVRTPTSTPVVSSSPV